MSDVDPTPETPTTISDRLGWFRGDMAAKLAAIVGNPAGNLGAIGAQIASIIGTPVRSLSELYEKMYDGLFDTSNPVHSPAHYGIQGRLDELADRIDTIQAVLGAEPYSSTETGNIRAILMNIMYGQNQTGILPDGTLSDYNQSTGSLATNGRRYVVWGNVPGVSESLDSIGLTPNTNWSGYEIYIQTASPSAILHNITGNTQVDPFPVNSWVPLSIYGTNALSFSVDASYVVKGYMRVPAPACAQFNAVLFGTNANGTWHGVDWAGLPRSTFAIAGGVSFYELVNNGQYDGYTINIKSSTGTVWLSTNRLVSFATGFPKTITGGIEACVYSNSAFSIWFCPPGVSPPSS